ncbi:MAG: ArsB/NhaD family transporter [Nitrospinae bacterium]|nr:ArsB/NhaD family transporter [Nitrospinota bacterium]
MTVAASILFLTYALIITEKFNKAIIALLGASLMIFTGILSQERAVEGVDFNTIGLLTGMMIIVAISQKTGMFQYLAIKSVKLVKGEPWWILVMLALITAVTSAFLDNVTTVLLIVPITLLITDELKINPYPFLFMQIFASNIGGTATLIGDPPNIMIGSAAKLTFMDFVINVAPIIPIIIIATIIPIKFIFGKQMVVEERLKQGIMKFDEREAIKDVRLLKKSLMVLGIVITGFVFQHQLHLEPATIAMSGAAILLLISGENLNYILEKIEWATIFFFVGLFIVVAGVEETGLIKLAAERMMAMTGGDMMVTAFVITWLSAVMSAFIDNIPFVATMIPMIKGMGEIAGSQEAIKPLWWALSLGACLGGNGSIIGASANVIVAGIADRSGAPIKFLDYMKLAFPLMLWSILISWVYIYLRYF